jgi:sulfur-oxidizing protein SoxZ
MESGNRRGPMGLLVPRKILNRLEVTFNGVPVFVTSLEPAIAANPTLGFFLRASESGALRFTWYDDAGEFFAHTQLVTVT